MPRCAKLIALLPILSSHIRTQSPQRMHLLSLGANRDVSIPKVRAMSRIGSAFGARASSNSAIILRAFSTDSEDVFTEISG
jgi:hypothetical protein